MKLARMSAQRRLMLWFFDDPANDPYVSITFDVNLEPARTFLDAYAREHGASIGLHALVTAVVGRSLRELPALNVKVFQRRLYQLDQVDVVVPIHLGGSGGATDETGMMILQGADRKSLRQISDETKRVVGAERAGLSSSTGSAAIRRAVRRLPQSAGRMAFGAASVLLRRPTSYRIVEPYVGVSTAVTNVGAVFTLPSGARYRAASAALPATMGHVASAFALAPAMDAPVVEEGRVVVRRVLPVTMIVDHRAIDGFLMARAAEVVASGLLSPERLANA